MIDDIAIPGGPTIPATELSWSASRSSGPGGQNVNKTSTRVTLEWSIAQSAVLDEAQRARLLDKLAGRINNEGVLQVHAEDARSQLRNRELAAVRLAELVEIALRRPKARRPTLPSRGAKERRLKAKKVRSDTKSTRKSPDW